MEKGTSPFSGMFLDTVKDRSSLSPAVAHQNTLNFIIAWPDSF